MDIGTFKPGEEQYRAGGCPNEDTRSGEFEPGSFVLPTVFPERKGRAWRKMSRVSAARRNLDLSFHCDLREGAH